MENVFDNKDNELRQLNDQVQELRLALQKERINANDKVEAVEARLAMTKEHLDKYEDSH